MATAIYTLDATPTFAPAANGSWSAGSPLVREMGTTKAGTAQAAFASHGGGTTQVYRFVTKPLTAAVTISGTLDFIMTATAGVGETYALRAHLWVTQGDTNAARGVLLNMHTSQTVNGDSSALGWGGTGVSLTSVAAQGGDRIVLEVGAGGGTGGDAIVYRAGTGADQAIGSTDGSRVSWIRFATPTMSFAERVPNVRAYVLE